MFKNYLILLLAAFLLWSSVWLRGVRWKFLFPEKNSPSISSLYKAEMIGYFGNNVLPLRLGELLRSYIVGKEHSLSKSFVFGTVILERLMDTIALALFALLLFGGPTIQVFLWVLLIGVVVGTFSSIGIATNLLVIWESGDIKRILRINN